MISSLMNRKGKGDVMFAMQRSEKILELLHKNETVQVHDLVRLFNVSDVTIRKDLKKLHTDGIITKTHGGAVLKRSNIPVKEIEPVNYNLARPKKINLLNLFVGILTTVTLFS